MLNMLRLNKFGFTYLSYRSLYSFQTIKLLILFRVLDPLLHYLFFATMAIGLTNGDYLTFILLGNLIFIMSQTMIINFISMFRVERLYGTLELNVAAPMPLFLIILKKSIVPLLDSILIFVISLIIIIFLFNVTFSVQSIPYLILTISIGLFSLLGISLLLASFSLLFSNVNLFLNLVLSVLQIFCGVNFPITLLPDILENIANFIPTTHVVQAIRLIFEQDYQSIPIILYKEAAIGTLYFLTSLTLIKIMELLSKRQGSLFKD